MPSSPATKCWPTRCTAKASARWKARRPSAGGLDGDQVFPTLVTSLLPVGLRGLVVAGLMAALMSSLSSLFNSTATLFTVDIYEKLKPGASEREYVHVGRLATVVVVALGLIVALGLAVAFGGEGCVLLLHVSVPLSVLLSALVSGEWR